MNMQYVKGQFVGYVDVGFGYFAVPAFPERWFVLGVTAGRDAKVLKAFDERCISRWSPTVVSFVNRCTGYAARRSHLGRRVVKPFLPGLLFVPDFEVDRARGSILSIPDVDGFLEFGTLRSWLNVAEMQLLRDIVVAENMPPSLKKKAQREISKRLRVVDGLFAGFYGLLERIDSSGRLSVYVDAGKSGVTVHGLTEAQIELID